MSPSDKIIESLSNLIQAFYELEEDLKSQHGVDTDDDELDEESEESQEVYSDLAIEVRASIETVMDDDDYSPEEIAKFFAMFSEALQEIAPDVFDDNEIEEIEDEDEDEFDFDDEEDEDEDYDDED